MHAQTQAISYFEVFLGKWVSQEDAEAGWYLILIPSSMRAAAWAVGLVLCCQ